MPQISLTVEAVLTGISIDPIGPKLIVQGVLREGEDARPVRYFSEDVTATLTASQLTSITNLATKAQAWLDAKVA